MNELDRRIITVQNLLNYISENDSFENREDVRSITIHTLAQTTQNFWFSLILSKNLLDISFCKSHFSDQIETNDLATISYNFDGFIKNAFFTNSFVYIENHIRQIALNYESENNVINIISITNTFRNLMNQNKISIFNSLDENDFKLFEFFCFMRNTMHNAGFQTKDNQSIEIFDSNSVINQSRVTISLSKDSANDLTFDNQLLLQEQIIKLVLKINSAIPENDFIKHRFSDIGFTDNI